jgi:putative transposase
VYLKGYAGLPELLVGLTHYFEFYNTERSHQLSGPQVKTNPARF